MYIGGKIKIGVANALRFTDSEWYIDVAEYGFMRKSSEVSKGVFESRLGNRGNIRLIYDIDKSASIPLIASTYVRDMDSYCTKGEIELLRKKGVSASIKTKIYDGVRLYSFEESPMEHMERIRNSVKAIHSFIIANNLTDKVLKIDEVSSEKDTMFISLKYNLPASHNNVYELYLQRELEKSGIRNICEMLSNSDDIISMLIRLFPTVR